MRPLIYLLFAAATLCAADFDIPANYNKFEVQIPMRDGVKLFTAVYTPKNNAGKLPILLTRTPYGVGPYGAENYPKHLGPLGFPEEQFIFVFQDVRGRFMSEGEFVDVRPVKDSLNGDKDSDETTDTYDTIDWLVKNAPNNNGKVGMIGTSYNGFYTTCGLIRSHPALLAASPQAPMADLYFGDDAYHNGAFFLIANFSFYTGFAKQANPTKPAPAAEFDYGTNDGYQFYLQMGPLANSDRLYLLNKNPYWTDMYTHTIEDEFWKTRNILPHLKQVTPAVLLVGGWYDAEDLSGTLKTFQAIRKQSPGTICRLAMGPWSHGAWNYQNGENLGGVNFEASTAEALRDLELRFFKQLLKGASPTALPQAFMFETGANRWQPLGDWPATGATRRFYLQPGGALGLLPTVDRAEDFDEYVSDPRNPVPYFDKPTLDMAKEYMIADQRFVSGRKDVLSYATPPLTEDLVIAGPVMPDLFVSTSATDSDFDVKLIDVDEAGGRQLVRGEPFRGKFRYSFEKPEPFVPNVPAELRFSMPDVFHCFRKGHRLMIQVQSSWFPLTDRNPQTFTDIPNAKAEDFVTATERVYHSRRHPSYVEATVVKIPSS